MSSLLRRGCFISEYGQEQHKEALEASIHLWDKLRGGSSDTGLADICLHPLNCLCKQLYACTAF